VGLGVAIELAEAQRARAHGHFVELRRHLTRALERLPGASLLEPGGPTSRAPHVVSLLVPGPPAESWQHHLEALGVHASVGSACQARKGGVSPALLALGLDEAQARQVLRLSFARTTTPAEIDAAAAALERVSHELGVRA
jgi:cysteine desulfurase